MATNKNNKKQPSQAQLNKNLKLTTATKKIVEHNRDFLKLELTLPLGNTALKQVHTNQWLWTTLPKEFELANWSVIAKHLNSSANRWENYVKNRWYIESNKIKVHADGKGEMNLSLNAFATTYKDYIEGQKSMAKAYNDIVNKQNTNKKSSASKSTSNALASNHNGLINESWVKKYSIPSVVVDKVKGCCKLGKSEEDNVYAWHKWMDANVQWEDYNDSKKSMQQIINDGKGNCCDNSRMFRYGCLALGVKCRFMQGSSCCAGGHCANHQWNIVYFSSGKKVVVDNGRGDASWGDHWGGCSSTWETDNPW